MSHLEFVLLGVTLGQFSMAYAVAKFLASLIDKLDK